MSGFRQIKDAARRVLHAQMNLDAYYYPPGGGAAVPVAVRAHTKAVNMGDLPGTTFAYSEVREIEPRILFLEDDLPGATRGGVFSVGIPGAFEAYQVSMLDPRDGITRTAACIRLDENEASAYPPPPEA